MSAPALLYPHHLDLWNPIHTIHRELATALSDRYRIVGFRDGVESPVETIHTKRIRIDANRLKKSVSYVRAYGDRYDLVHIGPSPRHRLAKLSQLRGAKIVHTLHSTPQDSAVITRQKSLSKKADALTAVSPYVREWAESELDCNNVSVVPNGVDLDHFTPDRAPTEQRSLLFIGRFIERKHPELPVQIAREIPEYTVKMRGGDASDIAGPVPENVEFLDYLSYDELADLYASSQCILCPFEREGFGMVVIEAMAAGTPVIGLNHGNLSHLITDRNGVLCESTDSSEWEDAIRRVINSYNAFSPRETVQKYAWSEIANKYDNIYTSLLPSNE
ncbi:glycosyltransferase family 4 protein [Haloarcula sp. 1CSR25-25]|uniref:glycosyltransferase family 4 protein n=1 Tax=Haloarcula sp. 1CSR25-25 TaxID=2862545 RepID=UPI002894F844|nr:glycosyltransferase family 4 protein [Haloarcula sp. 1CSR25-25]MDT3434234.1 glycosyltransferase family 4 protein [Haloarcula sp. 1CSR25-25]